jgi:hypothetical protein
MIKRFWWPEKQGLLRRRRSSRTDQRQIRRLIPPGLCHDCRNRILGRAVDEPVGPSHIHKTFMRHVPESADVQALEQHRALFGEGVFAVLEGFLHFDRPGLAYGDGGIGRILRQPERAFNPAFLRLADEDRNAVDFGVVVGFDYDLMIRSDELELRIYRTNPVRLRPT